MMLSCLSFNGRAAEGQDGSETGPIFVFSGSESFQAVVDNGSPRFLNLTHDGFAGVEFLHSPYTLGLWLEDAFTVDFAGMGNDVTFDKMINNNLSAGIDNTFFIKNLFYANANFYASYVLPYNQYKVDNYTPIDDMQYLLLNPLLKIGGMYYFGLDWEVEQDLPVKIIFNSNASSVRPTTIFNASYEFFRTSGPRFFRFSIKAGDSLAFSIPLQNLLSEVFEEDEGEEEDGASAIMPSNTLTNRLSLGLVFNLKSASASIGFSDTATYDMAAESITANEMGFSAGFSYTLNQFNFSTVYAGSMIDAAGSSKWVSNFNIGWSLNLSSFNQEQAK